MAKQQKSYIRPEAHRIDRTEYNRMRRREQTQRNWEKGGKPNTFFNKKKYSSPKATIYKAEKPPKATNGGNGGSRPHFGRTAVMGAVSILLLIGLIATVFFAYDNSNRAEGEPFQYFSPSAFLENISSQEYVVDSASYRVTNVYYRNFLFPSLSTYKGRIYIGNAVIESTNNILQSKINDNLEPFRFFVNGEWYTSYTNYVVNDDNSTTPETDINGNIIRNVSLPNMTISWNEMPDFTEVSSAWSAVNDNGTIWQAISATGKFIGQYLSYSGNMLTSLLPWNSVSSSVDEPIDETPIDIPFRTAVGSSEYKPLE